MSKVLSPVSELQMPVIVFDRVTKYYPLYHQITGGLKNFLFHLPKSLNSIRNSRFEALHDISFEVYKGETFGIVGKNGSGKSTILGLMAAVLRPTSGQISVNGIISPLLELGAGFHPELTGRENILLNGVLLGLTKAQVNKNIENIIAFSELGEFIDQPTRIYSSGMLARLGFSVIAHLEPEILLIDETLAVGDIAFQKKCVDKIAFFKRTGVTIVFVSHDTGTVERICDRVMWIDNHCVKMIGSAKEVLTEYLSTT